MSGSTSEHWDAAYARGADTVSWYQDDPAPSLAMIDGLGLSLDAGIVDVGGGASTLVDALILRGYHDLTVLDISEAALNVAQKRLSDRATQVDWVCADLRVWRPGRQFDVWHDRAVLHFLTAASEREAYRDLLLSALRPGGYVVLATFALDGPETCSGLPVQRYGPDQLADLLGPAFTTVASEQEHPTTPRGTPQSFTWFCARFDGVSALA